jgi:alkylhydroperoxidase family enzyme
MHCPDLLEHFNRFYEQLWRSARVSATIKELIRLRCATMNECHY